MSTATSPPDVGVLVIGAGIGGLCAAARLSQAGQRVLLAERGPDVGGRASSFVQDGFTINTGAVAIEVGGEMQRTFEHLELDLESLIRCPEPANVFRIRGKTVNPAKGGWAFLLDQITKRASGVLAGLGGARKGELPEEQQTLEEWIGGATSNQTVHRLFRNLAAAIFAVNADEIPARAFLTYFTQKGAFRRFGFSPDGTVGVCRALSGRVDEVWLDSEVVRLHAEDGRVTGATIRRGGEEVEVRCAAVVSNIGPVATLGLLPDAAVPADYAAAVRERSRPSANIIIHVASDEPLLDCPGLIVFSATDRLCNAGQMTALCPELAPDGQHLTVVYAVPRPAIGDFDEDEEVRLTLEELERELPGGRVLDVRVMRGDWPAQRAAAGFELPRDFPLDGVWQVGDGVRDYGSGGTQACAETARDVAEELLGAPIA